MDLVVSGVAKVYDGRDGEPRFALELPSFTFGIPSVVFLMGHNGAGKSVLLRLLAGEERPSNSSVRFVLGAHEWSPDEKSSPIVRQNVDQSLALDLSVRENLALHMRIRTLKAMSRPITVLRSQIEELVAGHAELQKKLDQPCRYLSGGQKQALAFLAVSAQNLPLLLLDEFLAATDQTTSALLRVFVKEYARKTPACVLIASHDVKLALDQGDRILALNAGRLVKDIQRDSVEWNESSLREILGRPL